MKRVMKANSGNVPTNLEELQPIMSVRIKTPRQKKICIRCRCVFRNIIIALCFAILIAIFYILIMGRVNNCFSVYDLDFDVVEQKAYNQSFDFETTDDAFTIVGDFQRTSWVECAINREVNDDETQVIIDAMAEISPAFVVMLGDFVFYGGDKRHWQHFDFTIRKLSETPLFPLLGNHDYCSNSMYLIESQRCDNDVAFQEYSKRFPRSFSMSTSGRQTSWYSHLYGSKSMGGAQLGLIWLDSNYYRLSLDEWKTQLNWLYSVVTSMESNPRVRGVLFFTHHSPFTNSLVVSGNEHVQDYFLPAFCQARKGMAFFTGHAHGLEHFLHDCSAELQTARVTAQPTLTTMDQNSNRHFVVTGGGGGPRPAGGLYSFNYRHYFDVLGETTSPRPFHFLRLSFLTGKNDQGEQVKNGIRVEAQGIDKGEKQVRLLNHFEKEFLPL